jgi:hypothetical protein
LEHVLVHTPGPELENMTPETAHHYLYSDILNLQVAQNEHKYFKGVLQKVAKVHEISDLLTDILRNESVKNNLVDRICKAENVTYLTDYMKSMDAPTLAKALIEGIHLKDITTIDESYYEAATIDGASDFQQAIYITIPLIKKTSLLTCVTLASVMGLRQFEQVYMLTNGGPANSTSTIVLYMYKKLQDANYGMASASAVILIIVGVIFIVCIRKIFEGRNEEAAAAKKARRALQ